MRLTVSLTVSAEIQAAPITIDRALGDCLVGGASLRSLQKEACVAAGMEVIDADGGAIHLKENAWVASAALEKLRDRSISALTRDGAVLAHRADASASEGSIENSVDVGSDGQLILYPWDFLNLQERLLAEVHESQIAEGAEVHERATIDGTLILGEGSRILPGVYIEGVAVVGRDCKIGPNAYLRGMNMIGDACHIGQAVEVKNSIIYPKTAIGHLSYCGDSVVGQGVNFGAGTIVSNFRHDGKNHRSMVQDQLIDTGRRKFGAIIGDGVHTGIHTSIYPGRKLWPHTSTRPGDIVQRDLIA